MYKLQKLLDSVNGILQQERLKKEESRKRGERFNIFDTLGVAHYEVTHSLIIASFLDINGSHGQCDKFLRILLSVIGDNVGVDTKNAIVYTEYSFSDGRIDILIEDNCHNGIIIENKIYALDQPEQLIRYNAFAKERYKKGKYAIYYLTLDGHNASKNSALNVGYKCISYAKDILKWLDICIKESVATPLIRETLIQYHNHIKQLTNQDMEAINKDKLTEIMAANAEAVAAIYNAIEQQDYKKYVYNTYVRPGFEIFCEKNDLIYSEYNLFGTGTGRGFYFRRKEWKEMAIFFYTDMSSESKFYWGISNYQDEGVKVDKAHLDCINGEGNDGWPYGNEYLSKYNDWDVNTLAKMVKGDYVKYITDLVSKAIEEIDNKNLPMP